MNPYLGHKNKNNKVTIAWESIHPIDSVDIKSIFKIDKDDIIIAILAFSTTIITWIAFRIYSGSFSILFSFWDSSDAVLYTLMSSGKARGQDMI